MAKRALGRGLDALIPRTGDQLGTPSESPSDLAAGLSARFLKCELLYGNPDQPRKDFDPGQLEELAASIREKGILQPILVEEDGQGKYRIIAGERRFRAAAIAGLEEVPVIIRSFSEQERLEIALIENIQREDLNPIEEALAFKQLIETHGLSQEETAKKVGKSRSVVANSLRLLNLPEEILEAIRRSELSSGHARAVLAVARGEEAQLEMFRSISKFELSVRESEALAKLINGGQSAPEAIPSLRPEPQAGPAPEDEIQKIISRAKDGDLSAAFPESQTQKKKSAELEDLEQRLIEALGTKVLIKGDEQTGRIELSYYSMEDLERLFDLLTGNKG